MTRAAARPSVELSGGMRISTTASSGPLPADKLDEPGGVAWRPFSLLASWKAGSKVSTRE
jgi:hypothetical protein